DRGAQRLGAAAVVETSGMVAPQRVDLGFATSRRNRTSENQMQAAFYVKQGPAREVLEVGAQPTPEPGPGEVSVHLKTSGVNPSDWKSRSGRTAPMSAPLIIPHSDGAGDIDRVGPGVANRIGERVWVWNGQWRRPYGTAAEYIVLPSAQAVLLPKHIGYAEG